MPYEIISNATYGNEIPRIIAMIIGKPKILATMIKYLDRVPVENSFNLIDYTSEGTINLYQTCK